MHKKKIIQKPAREHEPKGFRFKRYVLPLLNVRDEVVQRVSLKCTPGFQVGANPNVFLLLQPSMSA